jgi:outer membrane protein TolC
MASVDRKLVCVLLALAGTSQGQISPRLSLSLRQAIDLAAKQNPLVEIARLRVLQAESSVKAARSSLLPQVGLNAISGYEDLNLKALGFNAPGLPTSTGPFQQFDLRPSLTQMLYDPGTRKAVLAARERAQETRFDAESVEESTLLAVTELYLEALSYGALIDAGVARQRGAAARLDQVRKFVDAGTASRLDQSRAGIIVDNESRALVGYRSGLAIKKLQLGNLLGLPADTDFDLSEAFEPPRAGGVAMEAAVGRALEKRPEMKAAQAKLRAAMADKQKAEYQRLPVIGIATDFGRMGNTLWSNMMTYTVRATVQLPILQGGRVEAEVSSADTSIRQAGEEIRSAKQQIEMDVHVAAIELGAAVEAYESAADAASLAQKSLELAADRFEDGLSSDIEVVNAQEALASAQTEAIRCVFDYHIARARLARAEGDVRGLFE